MMSMLKKYSGILFFYLVIIGMVLLISARFSYLNDTNVAVGYVLSD